MLLTDEFPYAYGEPFLLPEIAYLSEEFSLTIVSSNTTSSVTKSLSPEIPIHRVKYTLSLLEKIKYGFSFFGNSVCRQELLRILKTKGLHIVKIKQAIGAYALGTMWYHLLEKLDDFSQQDILYFYWYNAKLVGTALAMRNKLTRPIILCRLHGYDLYNERVEKTFRQPFKPLLDSYIDHLFFVSNAGYEYYKTTFGFRNPQKYSISYLGSENSFGIARPHSSSSFILVSCSNVIPLKRVELIIRALALINEFVISWTHLGGGSSLQSVIELAQSELGKKDTITFNFTGNLENSQIHEYYQNNDVDSFILVSETEGGCPVSIQEAMSYGIPIIGTSVGGIPEMIAGNGFLLGENPTDVQVAEAIQGMFDAKRNGTMREMREASRQVWVNNFNSDINFSHFVKEISQLHRPV